MFGHESDQFSGTNPLTGAPIISTPAPAPALTPAPYAIQSPYTSIPYARYSAPLVQAPMPQLSINVPQNGTDVEQIMNAISEMKMNEHVSTPLRQLSSFINDPAFAAGPGAKYNIFNISGMKWNIPDSSIPTFFVHLENARRSGNKLSYAELQDDKSSGLVIDFDMYQNIGIPVSQVTEKLIMRLIKDTIEFLKVHLDLRYFANEKKSIVVFVKRKPNIATKTKDGIQYNTDGIHLIIPSIKMSRMAKRFIIGKMTSTKLFHGAFQDLRIDLDYTLSELPDHRSSYFVWWLYGTTRDITKPPYILWNAYDIDMLENLTFTVQRNEHLTDSNPSVVLAHEMSLNYETPIEYRCVNKVHIDVLPEYADKVNAMTISPGSTNEVDALLNAKHNIFDDVALLCIQNSTARYLKQLLDIINPARAIKYDSWFEVMCCLANTSPNLKPLGRYFSNRIPEAYNHVFFEKTWNSIINNVAQNARKNIDTLRYIAKTDEPEKFRTIERDSIYGKISEKVDNYAVQGEFMHYDIADVLHSILGDRFVCCHEDRPAPTWFEHILPNDPKFPDKAYKYVRHAGQPAAVQLYMSEQLVKAFESIYDKRQTSMNSIPKVQMPAQVQTPVAQMTFANIMSQLPANTPESKAQLEAEKRKTQYCQGILNGLKKTMRALRTDGFKNGVMNQCSHKFYKYEFYKRLDIDPLIIGIKGNIGGLRFYPNTGRIEVLDSPGDYFITKHTNVRFVPFDPTNEFQRDLLRIHRGMFTDYESDSHEFLFCFMAQGMTGMAKPPILLQLLGQGAEGKSTLVALLCAIFGHYANKIGIGIITDRAAHANSATTAKNSVIGKRVVTLEEPGKNTTLQAALEKELMSGENNRSRGLYKEEINFLVECIFLLPTNYLLRIYETDDGTWRRNYVLKLSIRYGLESEAWFDKNNPNHRILDRRIESLKNDERYLEAFFSILTFYWQKLQIFYKGDVRNIPHPNIKIATARYRASQDSIDDFINRQLVKTDEAHVERINTIINTYVAWVHAKNPNVRVDTSTMENDLKQSKIGKYVSEDREGAIIRGMRFLAPGTDRRPNETFPFDETAKAMTIIDTKISQTENKEEVQQLLEQKTEIQVRDLANSNGQLNETVALRNYRQSMLELKNVQRETTDQFLARIEDEHRRIQEHLKTLEENENKQTSEADDFIKQTINEEHRRFIEDKKRELDRVDKIRKSRFA